MWYFILGAMFLVTVASVTYLVSRFNKFAYVRKWGGEKRLLRLVFAGIPVVLILGGTWLAIGIMNAMITMIHFLFIWLLCDLVSGLIQKKRGTPFKRYYAGIFAIVITVVYLMIGWYLANNVWSTKYEISTEKEVGKLRIVQIADSHVGTTFDGRGFAGWMEKIQKENPDVLVVTGDYVDDDTPKKDMVEACRALGSVQTTYGVYFVFGNHDKGYFGDEYRGYSGADLIAELEKNNVKVLQDENVLINDKFYLIGRKDRSEDIRGGSRLGMEELVRDLDADKYQIVLDHQPHDYDAQEKAKVDLVLSGHTHGGQLIPINLVGEWTGANDKVYGLETRDRTNYIVTSGISDWAIKFKTGCKSEYVVVDISGK